MGEFVGEEEACGDGEDGVAGDSSGDGVEDDGPGDGDSIKTEIGSSEELTVVSG